MIRIRWLVTRILLFSFFISARAQDDVALFNYWQYYSDIENSLYKHFCSVVGDSWNQEKKRSAG